MKIQDVIDMTRNGIFPNVKDVKESIVGTITTIQTFPNGYRGIAVRYNSKSYDYWYYEEHGTDKRKRYMQQLIFNET